MKHCLQLGYLNFVQDIGWLFIKMRALINVMSRSIVGRKGWEREIKMESNGSGWMEEIRPPLYYCRKEETRPLLIYPSSIRKVFFIFLRPWKYFKEFA